MSDGSPSAAAEGPGEGFVGSAEQFAELARALASEPTVQATLQRIVDSAVENIDGCDGAGVLLVHRGEIVVGAWSDDLVRQIETMEYELGEGPCLDAISQEPVFESADLADQVSRWPRFGFRLSMPGFTACSGSGSSPPRTPSGRWISMATSRVFSTRRAGPWRPFWRHTRRWLAGAQLHERDLDTVAQLREALIARDVIGQAKGILMVTRDVDADAAFELLSVHPKPRT